MLVKFNENLRENLFFIFIFFIYFLSIVSLFSLYKNSSKYLEKVNYYFKLYICLLLIWRFNPFKKVEKFTNLDRKIAFSAGLMLMTNTILGTYLDYIKTQITNYLR